MHYAHSYYEIRTPHGTPAKANSLKSRKSRRPQSASQQFNGSSSGNAENDDDDEEFEEDAGNGFEDGEALYHGSPVASLTDANNSATQMIGKL